MDSDDEHAHAHTVPTRANLVRLSDWTEIVLLGFVGAALFIAAVVVVVQGVFLFATNLFDRHYGIGLELLLDRMLITMMIVEILDTVRITISSHKLRCQPFLIVGVIAATRQILLITLQSTVTSTSSLKSNLPDSLSLVGLVLVIIGLAIALAILKKSNIP
jgi:uncharacterized membrane protein (DUF373 family)